MSTARRIARRSFIIGSAAVAGGVAFGLYAVKRRHDNPLIDGLAAGEVSFNPWIVIGPERIVLIAPHTDVGQGARSMQAMLIAEELDLDFGSFDVEPGPPAAAYWNTASAADGVPFRHGDDGLAARIARGAVRSVVKVVGLQVTGGSSSVADSWVKLRQAGAMARETLKLAAARRTGFAVGELTTSAGFVSLPDGSSLSYQALAPDAAALEPVTEVELREPDDWRLVGRNVRRIDIVGKSTGTIDYGIDLAMDNMLHATVRFNPRQGGRMLGYDAARARSMPGIRDVFEVTDGVAVIADNTWRAFQAAEAIDFDWGPAPYPHEMDAHWSELDASFVDERLDKVWRDEGDAESALAGGDAAFEAEYRAPYLAHAPLEPLSALIVARENDADLWVASQLPRFAQDIAAGILGLDADAVRLHNPYCGGSFGHRLEFENIRYAAEIANRLRGTPVKLTFRREEDFAHDFVRPIAMSRARGAVSERGIETLDIAVASPAVMASQASRIGMPAPGPDNQIPAGIWTAPYAIPDFRVRAYRVPGLAPTSSWRSVGASSGGFFIESAIDELARAAGADPLEERLRLCSDRGARSVLEAVAEMSDWGSEPGADRGRGVALVVSFGVPVAEVVEVTATDEGLRIDRVWVAAETGRVVDPINFENQVQGGVIWGLGHAMNCEITYSDGMAQQRNYDSYRAMRMGQTPAIEVRGIESGNLRGIGEPPVPPAAPALANAIFDATGERLREMPFSRFVSFL
ncbi:MAG: molybdopterin cofactor-binding domain-containing protein [Woeseiaceae bacterium]|nr:molybdopterin cofactor-binding domain-containing protein [Woeseiaceae bacterium]